MEESAVLLLDRFPNPSHAPVYVAQRAGFFREEGLDLSILIPSDPGDPVKLAASSKIELALASQHSALLARSRGLPVVSIGLLVDHPLAAILFLKGAGIVNLGSLKGRRIGVSTPSDQVLFEAVARAAGVEGEDWALVDVSFNATLALLERRVDAVVGTFQQHEATELELQGAEVGTLELHEHGVPDFAQLLFIAPERLIESRPEVCRKFIHALAKGIAFTRHLPEEALEVYFTVNPQLRNELHERAFEAVLPFYAGSQEQPEERWATLQEFFWKHGLIEQRGDVHRLFTGQFVPWSR